MTVRLESGNLIITVPANTVSPSMSSSGKSLLVASESEKDCGLKVMGRTLKVAVNAYIPAR